MDFTTANTILLVLGSIAGVIAMIFAVVWIVADDGIAGFFALITGIIAIAILIPTMDIGAIHAGNREAGRDLSKAGFKATMIATDDNNVYLKAGSCIVIAKLYKNEGAWRPFMNLPDGSRVLLKTSKLNAVGSACS